MLRKGHLDTLFSTRRSTFVYDVPTVSGKKDGERVEEQIAARREVDVKFKGGLMSRLKAPP